MLKCWGNLLLFSRNPCPTKQAPPKKQSLVLLVIHQWHAVIWLVGNWKYFQYETEGLTSATHQRSSMFSSQWGVVPNNFVRKMTHDQILFWSNVSRDMTHPQTWRLDCWDRGLGALLVEKFLKAHGALYEQKAHPVFFLFLEGWVEYMVVDLLKWKSHGFIQGKRRQHANVWGWWWCPRNKDDFDRFVQDEFEGWQWWNPLQMISDQDLSL